MSLTRPDPFREIAGIRRHWNRVVLASPQTLNRLLEVSPTRPDPFRPIAGIRRHWNRVVLMSPATMQRLLAISDELACVYAILNRSCDADGFATITPSEISVRMVEPTRKVLEWIGTLIELEIIHLGICPDGARLLIAEWDEAEYQKASKGDCRE